MSENKGNTTNSETPAPYTEATKSTAAKSSTPTTPRNTMPLPYGPLQGHPPQAYPTPPHAPHQHPYSYMYPPYSYYPHPHSTLPGAPIHHSESSTHESPLSTPQPAALPLSSEIDPATGLPLSILNNLRDLLPSNTNTNPKNKFYKPSKENAGNDSQSHQNRTQESKNSPQPTQKASKLSSLASKSKKSDSDASKTVSSKHDTDTKTSKNSNKKSIEGDENTEPENNANFSTPITKSGKAQSSYLDVESTTNPASTESFLEHLKSVNASLHQSVASGNFSIHAFETQIKSIDQEFNSYNHTIGELILKLEKEDEKTLGKGPENDTEKGDINESPLQRLQRSKQKQTESSEEENTLLLEKIDALEKELLKEKRIAKATYKSMEKKLLKESEELDQECKKIENRLENEYQTLLDTNKALLSKDQEV